MSDSNGTTNENNNDNDNTNNSSTDNPVPMFQMSNSAAGASSGNLTALDLDDLFMDCYYDVPGAPGSEPSMVTSTDLPVNTMMGSVSNANTGTDLSTMTGGGGASDALAADTATSGTMLAAGGGGSGGNGDGNSTSSSNIKKRSSDEAGLAAGTAEESDAPLTDKQKLERRERNREHAKRSRLRKKFLLESLQEQIHGLQEQMDQMKEALKRELPHKADMLIHQICGNRDKYTPLPMPSGFGPVKTLMEPDFRLMSALSGSQQNFAISDPTLPDNPIVYVSQGFLDLTGYSLDQVLGRNCRFLQGPGTDQSAVDVIRKGISEGIDTSVCLLNYKADGTPFWNQFFVAALRDAENNVVNYVGVQCEVSKAVVEKHLGEGKK